MAPGETLGLVGESGSGKSTIGKAILGLQPPAAGQVLLHGADITRASLRRRRVAAIDLRVVFQDPYSSLNPAQTIGQTLRAAAGAAGAEGRAVAAGLRRADRRRPARRRGRPLPRAVLRRAAAADRDRPRPGLRPEGHRARRAGQRARPVHPGPGAQPARRPARRPAARAAVHRPRPGRRPVPRPAGGGALPRPGDGGGPGRGRHPAARPPLHHRADRGGPGAAARRAGPPPRRQGGARRRDGGRGAAAGGRLPVRHPLPPRHRRLPRRAAAAGRPGPPATTPTRRPGSGCRSGQPDPFGRKYPLPSLSWRSLCCSSFPTASCGAWPAPATRTRAATTYSDTWFAEHVRPTVFREPSGRRATAGSCGARTSTWRRG